MFPTCNITLTAPQGLLSFLREELRGLGYPVIWTSKSAIGTRGDFVDTMRLNMWLRTAHHVLYQLKEFSCSDVNELYRSVGTIAWEGIIPADGYFSVAATVSHPAVRDHRIVNLTCKDAVVDRIAQKKGRRPDSGAKKDGAVVTVFWKGDRCVVSIDTSGEPLTKRGYRKIPLQAPMQETLAAGVIHATKYDGSGYFVNPMCGSGTIAIEAALIATNRAPGLTRKNYGFMHTCLFDADAWKKIVHDARDKIVAGGGGKSGIIASDISGRSIQAARTNAEAAGIGNRISFSTVDFSDTAVPRGMGVVVFNPEYGLRLGSVPELVTTYRRIGAFLKRKCQGYRGYVFTASTKLAANVGLKSGRKMKFQSGSIDCRLYEYNLFTGKADERRK